MRAYVYTDASLDRYAGRFVWLSINTEDAKNAAFLKKYPIPVLPTLLVLDPKRDAIALRYIGGATVAQLRRMLDESSAKKAPSPSELLLAQGDKLANAGDHAGAAVFYEQALDKAPKSWPRYGRAAESLLFSLMMGQQHEHCVTLARFVYPRVRGTSSAANVASTGLTCATQLDEKRSGRAELIAELEKDTQEVFDDPKLTLSGDDRSGLYMSLIEARAAVKDEAGEKKLIEDWSAFLDREAANAKTPEQRAVYDPHRLSAYIELKTPEKAIPMLAQSEREFPNDYNPPARLAVAYREMKKYDEALAASDRALRLAYGPRKLGMLTTRADIYTEKGDKESARKTLAEAIAYAKSLPDPQRNDRRIAALEKKLAAMQ
ncbi:MAG TPA: tetratricopeptide repeat protein [Thermoanaerobaculia bacterium]|nr:tetratricopeptide repeat protein [Thermoanaerobaculia bacterium]